MQFTASVYEHAAKLIHRTPGEVSRNGDLLYEAHAEAFRVYEHSPIVVGIDIYNLEAEAYGATVGRPDGNGIPAVTGHACKTAADISRLSPMNPAKDGRIPMVIEAGKRLAKAFPDADVRIPVSGPFSLAGNLVGLDRLLCDIADEPGMVAAVLALLVEGQLAFCAEIVHAGLDVAFFESAATPPLISPKMFANVELPALKLIIAGASAIAGHPVPCIIGGDTAPILESLLETGTGYVICPCETNQELFMRKMAAHPDVMVRVNMRPEVFSTGDMAAVCREVDRVVELVKDRQKACLGTGVLPFETDPQTVLKARRYVSEKYA